MSDPANPPQAITVKCPKCGTLVRARRPFGVADKAMSARAIEQIKAAYDKGREDAMAEQAKREGT